MGGLELLVKELHNLRILSRQILQNFVDVCLCSLVGLVLKVVLKHFELSLDNIVSFILCDILELCLFILCLIKITFLL